MLLSSNLLYTENLALPETKDQKHVIQKNLKDINTLNSILFNISLLSHTHTKYKNTIQITKVLKAIKTQKIEVCTFARPVIRHDILQVRPVNSEALHQQVRIDGVAQEVFGWARCQVMYAFHFNDISAGTDNVLTVINTKNNHIHKIC